MIGKRRWLVCIYHWLWKNNCQMCGLLIVGGKLPTNNRNVVFILSMFLFNSELLLSDKLMEPHKSFGKWIYKNLSVVNIAKCYMLYMRKALTIIAKRKEEYSGIKFSQVSEVFYSSCCPFFFSSLLPSWPTVHLDSQLCILEFYLL